jgi:hypothetical protein
MECLELFCRCLVAAKSPQVMVDTLSGLGQAGADAAVCAVTSPIDLVDMVRTQTSSRKAIQ